MFERVAWQADRALVGNLVFRLEHFKNDQWELGDRCFAFYKTKGLIDQYERAFSRRPGFSPRHVLELGMWDGGRLAFWNEILHPEEIVGVDLQRREDSTYFREYVQDQHLESKVRSYWATDQADERALRSIVDREFGGALDLVFDDASHLYGPTLSSLEIIFPLMTAGGLYVIEDWAWEHWPSFGGPDHPWDRFRSPTAIVLELVEAAGTSQGVIASVEVVQGFVIIERGASPEISPLRLADHITRRPPVMKSRREAAAQWWDAVRKQPRDRGLR